MRRDWAQVFRVMQTESSRKSVRTDFASQKVRTICLEVNGMLKVEKFRHCNATSSHTELESHFAKKNCMKKIHKRLSFVLLCSILTFSKSGSKGKILIKKVISSWNVHAISSRSRVTVCLQPPRKLKVCSTPSNHTRRMTQTRFCTWVSSCWIGVKSAMSRFWKRSLCCPIYLNNLRSFLLGHFGSPINAEY